MPSLSSYSSPTLKPPVDLLEGRSAKTSLGPSTKEVAEIIKGTDMSSVDPNTLSGPNSSTARSKGLYTSSILFKGPPKGYVPEVAPSEKTINSDLLPSPGHSSLTLPTAIHHPVVNVSPDPLATLKAPPLDGRLSSEPKTIEALEEENDLPETDAGKSTVYQSPLLDHMTTAPVPKRRSRKPKNHSGPPNSEAGQAPSHVGAKLVPENSPSSRTFTGKEAWLPLTAEQRQGTLMRASGSESVKCTIKELPLGGLDKVYRMLNRLPTCRGKTPCAMPLQISPEMLGIKGMPSHPPMSDAAGTWDLVSTGDAQRDMLVSGSSKRLEDGSPSLAPYVQAFFVDEAAGKGIQRLMGKSSDVLVLNAGNLGTTPNDALLSHATSPIIVAIRADASTAVRALKAFMQGLGESQSVMAVEDGSAEQIALSSRGDHSPQKVWQAALAFVKSLKAGSSNSFVVFSIDPAIFNSISCALAPARRSATTNALPIDLSADALQGPAARTWLSLTNTSHNNIFGKARALSEDGSQLGQQLHLDPRAHAAAATLELGRQSIRMPPHVEQRMEPFSGEGIGRMDNVWSSGNSNPVPPETTSSHIPAQTGNGHSLVPPGEAGHIVKGKPYALPTGTIHLPPSGQKEASPTASLSDLHKEKALQWPNVQSQATLAWRAASFLPRDHIERTLKQQPPLGMSNQQDLLGQIRSLPLQMAAPVQPLQPNYAGQELLVLPDRLHSDPLKENLPAQSRGELPRPAGPPVDPLRKTTANIMPALHMEGLGQKALFPTAGAHLGPIALTVKTMSPEALDRLSQMLNRHMVSHRLESAAPTLPIGLFSRTPSTEGATVADLHAIGSRSISTVAPVGGVPSTLVAMDGGAHSSLATNGSQPSGELLIKSLFFEKGAPNFGEIERLMKKVNGVLVLTAGGNSGTSIITGSAPVVPQQGASIIVARSKALAALIETSEALLQGPKRLSSGTACEGSTEALTLSASSPQQTYLNVVLDALEGLKASLAAKSEGFVFLSIDPALLKVLLSLAPTSGRRAASSSLSLRASSHRRPPLDEMARLVMARQGGGKSSFVASSESPTTRRPWSALFPGNRAPTYKQSGQFVMRSGAPPKLSVASRQVPSSIHEQGRRAFQVLPEGVQSPGSAVPPTFPGSIVEAKLPMGGSASGNYLPARSPGSFAFPLPAPQGPLDDPSHTEAAGPLMHEGEGPSFTDAHADPSDQGSSWIPPPLPDAPGPLPDPPSYGSAALNLDAPGISIDTSFGGIDRFPTGEMPPGQDLHPLESGSVGSSLDGSGNEEDSLDESGREESGNEEDILDESGREGSGPDNGAPNAPLPPVDPPMPVDPLPPSTSIPPTFFSSGRAIRRSTVLGPFHQNPRRSGGLPRGPSSTLAVPRGPPPSDNDESSSSSEEEIGSSGSSGNGASEDELPGDPGSPNGPTPEYNLWIGRVDPSTWIQRRRGLPGDGHGGTPSDDTRPPTPRRTTPRESTPPRRWSGAPRDIPRQLSREAPPPSDSPVTRSSSPAGPPRSKRRSRGDRRLQHHTSSSLGSYGNWRTGIVVAEQQQQQPAVQNKAVPVIEERIKKVVVVSLLSVLLMSATVLSSYKLYLVKQVLPLPV